MTNIIDPVTYEAWYHTPRGTWISDIEFSLLMGLLQPQAGQTLLDVGSGTGYFSRHFAKADLQVTGIELQPDMIRYAQTQGGNVEYIEGMAQRLPFKNESFDFCSAITSLCFVQEPEQALAEMWRVSRTGIILGLLNTNSLLYCQKHGRGGYEGARWDSARQARAWLQELDPLPVEYKLRTAIFSPVGGILSRSIEKLLPNKLLWGGFLVVYALKSPVLK